MDRQFLVAIPRQGFANDLRVAVRGRRRSAEVSLTLLAHSRGQMARASRSVLGLAFGTQAKTLLRAFVGFLLGHGIGLVIGRWDISPGAVGGIP